MKRLIPVCVVALVLTSGSIVRAQTSVSIGINIGSPPPPRVVYVAPPPAAPGYVWVTGYWYPVKHKHNKHTYEWHDGYWTLPPYAGARWVPARYDREVFYIGYWDGPRGRVYHDHRWDGDHDRDYRDGRGRGRGRGKG